MDAEARIAAARPEQAAAEAQAAAAARMAAAVEAAEVGGEQARAAEDDSATEPDSDAAEAAQPMDETLPDAAVPAEPQVESAEDAAVTVDVQAGTAGDAAEQPSPAANEEIAEPEIAPVVDPPANDLVVPLEDAADRAAAQRIDDAANTAAEEGEDGIMNGVAVAGPLQPLLGAAPALTVAVPNGAGLKTNEDRATGNAPPIRGWNGANLVKDGPGPVTQTALVYTDIEPSVRAWGDVYSYTVGAAGNPGGAALPPSSLTHIVIAERVATPRRLRFVDRNIELTHGLSSTIGLTTRTATETITVRGFYDGARGIYVLNTSSTIELDASGNVLLTVDGPLTFRADDPDRLHRDKDPLAFGVWAEIPDEPSRTNPGRVRAFAHGSTTPYNGTHIWAFVDDDNNPDTPESAVTLTGAGMLQGSATYTGGAVGHWATRSPGNRLTEQGRFTATAVITADFNGPGLTISGTVNRFRDEARRKSMADWRVDLRNGVMATADNPTGVILGRTDGFTDVTLWEGVWDARLYGDNKTSLPSGVAGRFQAEAGTAEPVLSPAGGINPFADEGFAGVIGAFAGRR
ncbi:MAG: hypothetical protein OXP66_08250 [Candidatus Tectomicrobia bacterium]|nr:hypothetical protein [Candidatus Tectomicrobia bacterium]